MEFSSKCELAISTINSDFSILTSGSRVNILDLIRVIYQSREISNPEEKIELVTVLENFRREQDIKVRFVSKKISKEGVVTFMDDLLVAKFVPQFWNLVSHNEYEFIDQLPDTEFFETIWNIKKE